MDTERPAPPPLSVLPPHLQPPKPPKPTSKQAPKRQRVKPKADAAPPPAPEGESASKKEKKSHKKSKKKEKKEPEESSFVLFSVRRNKPLTKPTKRAEDKSVHFVVTGLFFPRMRGFDYPAEDEIIQVQNVARPDKRYQEYNLSDYNVRLDPSDPGWKVRPGYERLYQNASEDSEDDDDLSEEEIAQIMADDEDGDFAPRTIAKTTTVAQFLNHLDGQDQKAGLTTEDVRGHFIFKTEKGNIALDSAKIFPKRRSSRSKTEEKEPTLSAKEIRRKQKIQEELNAILKDQESLGKNWQLSEDE